MGKGIAAGTQKPGAFWAGRYGRLSPDVPTKGGNDASPARWGSEVLALPTGGTATGGNNCSRETKGAVGWGGVTLGTAAPPCAEGADESSSFGGGKVSEGTATGLGVEPPENFGLGADMATGAAEADQA